MIVRSQRMQRSASESLRDRCTSGLRADLAACSTSIGTSINQRSPNGNSNGFAIRRKASYRNHRRLIVDSVFGRKLRGLRLSICVSQYIA